MSPVSVATRLPTRCPTCKGAVIQRMPGRAHGASIWLYCFFCNYTWKCRAGDARAVPDGELTGAMFVVATRKRRLSLGLVELHAIPEEALKKHLQRRTAQRELEIGKLQREIDALTATLEKVRAEEDRLWKIQKQDESDLRKANAWSVAYNNTKRLTKQFEDLRTRRQHLTSGDHFLQDLPSAISSATTNADGTFTLPIPRDGRYGIVARASRDLGEEKQTYFWFVWVSLDGALAKRLVLNNDNIVGAGSPDSALQ
jgi:hypothetical protein